MIIDYEFESWRGERELNTGYATGWTVHGSISGSVRSIFFFSKTFRQTVGPPSLLFFFQLYNSLWVLACSVISFHYFLSCVLSFPIGYPNLPQIIPHIVFPSYSWPSLQFCCIRFPFVYGLGHSFIGHSFYMPHTIYVQCEYFMNQEG